MTHNLHENDMSIELENVDLDYVDTLIPQSRPGDVIAKERSTKEFHIFDSGQWNDIVSLGDRLKFKLYYKNKLPGK